METRFARAKKFVRDHKVGIVIGAGVVAVVVIVVMKTPGSSQPRLLTRVKVTNEQLQHLLDHPESVLAYDVSPNEKIWVINAASKEL